MAYVKDFDLKCGRALIEVRNKFAKGDLIEVFGPDMNNERFKVEEMYTLDEELVEVANQPMELLWIRVPFLIKTHYMMRKVIR